MSTLSGTNQFHGALFDFLRNNDFDARPYAFTSAAPLSSPFKWNQYGYTLGGPVWIPKLFNGKNRLFFMSNYEGFKLRQQTQTVYTTFPAAFRTGDFSSVQATHVITDPTTGLPFPGNIIPANRLDTIAKGLPAVLSRAQHPERTEQRPVQQLPRAGQHHCRTNISLLSAWTLCRARSRVGPAALACSMKTA